LVDGGFVNKIPVEICRARGAGYVIAVSVSPQDFKLEDSFPEVERERKRERDRERERYSCLFFLKKCDDV